MVAMQPAGRTVGQETRQPPNSPPGLEQAGIQEDDYTGFVELIAACPAEILSLNIPVPTVGAYCSRFRLVVQLRHRPRYRMGDVIPQFITGL